MCTVLHPAASSVRARFTFDRQDSRKRIALRNPSYTLTSGNFARPGRSLRGAKLTKLNLGPARTLQYPNFRTCWLRQVLARTRAACLVAIVVVFLQKPKARYWSIAAWTAAFHKYAIAAAASGQLNYAAAMAHLDNCLMLAEDARAKCGHCCFTLLCVARPCVFRQANSPDLCHCIR